MKFPAAAVTFDLWHTLIYLRPRAEERYVQQQSALAADVLESSPVRRGGPRLGREALEEAFRKERVRAVAAADQGRVVTVAEQIAHVGLATGRKVDPEAYLALLEREVARTPFLRASGAISTLRELRKEGYRVALVSNTVGEPGAFLRPVLHHLGLDRWFETCVFSDEQPCTKPAPQIFRTALRAVGSDPAHALHVGDGWGDIEGARRAGYRSYVYFLGLQDYGPSYRALHAAAKGHQIVADHRIDHLGALLPLVRRLLGHPKSPPSPTGGNRP